MVSGCTFPAVPYTFGSSLGIAALGTVEHLQPELVLVCPRLLPNPRFHFGVGDKTFICTVGLFQKTLACKGSLETSCAQKLIPPRTSRDQVEPQAPCTSDSWTKNSALTLASISPLLPFSGHLEDTETITAFIELNLHSRLLV